MFTPTSKFETKKMKGLGPCFKYLIEIGIECSKWTIERSHHYGKECLSKTEMEDYMKNGVLFLEEKGYELLEKRSHSLKGEGVCLNAVSSARKLILTSNWFFSWIEKRLIFENWLLEDYRTLIFASNIIKKLLWSIECTITPPVTYSLPQIQVQYLIERAEDDLNQLLFSEKKNKVASSKEEQRKWEFVINTEWCLE